MAAVAGLGFGAWTGLAAHAFALEDTDQVILTSDEDQLEVEKGDGDSLTGSLTLTNLTGAEVTPDLTGIEGCEFEFVPERLPVNRTVKVEVTSEKCDFTNTPEVVLSFGGELDTITLTLKASDPPEDLDVHGILLFFVMALVGAVLVAVAVWRWRPNAPSSPLTTAFPADSWKAQVAWVFLRGWRHKGNKTSRVRAADEIPDLETGWSLTESWASNLSILATAFAALFGGTDILKAVLGDEPALAIARVLVAGAVATLLVAAAPLVLAAVGKSSKPSVLGLLLGGVLTTTGVVGQVLTIGWAVEETELSDGVGSTVTASTYVAAALLYIYGGRTLHFLLRESFKPAEPRSPTDAQLIALAVMHGDNGEPVAELQKLEDSFAAADNAAETAAKTDTPVADATRAVLDRRTTEQARHTRKTGIL